MVESNPVKLPANFACYIYNHNVINKFAPLRNFYLGCNISLPPLKMLFIKFPTFARDKKKKEGNSQKPFCVLSTIGRL